VRCGGISHKKQDAKHRQKPEQRDRVASLRGRWPTASKAQERQDEGTPGDGQQHLREGEIVPSRLSVTSSPGASEIHSILYWTDPLLAYGAPHLTYTVTFKVASNARGNAYIGVAAFSATPDPNLLNNVALTAVKLG
jgi:hypothetical protein